MQVDDATTFTQIYQQTQAGGEFANASAEKHLRLSKARGLHLKREDKGSGIHVIERAEKHKKAAEAVKRAIDKELGPGKGETVFKRLRLSQPVSVGDLSAIKQQVDVMTPLKPVLPAAVQLQPVSKQPALLEGRLEHTMAQSDLPGLRANLDRKVAASKRDAQFLKDYHRAEITLVDKDGSRTLPAMPGNDMEALTSVNWIAGKGLEVSSHLCAFLNQSAFNAMNEEFSRTFANANGDKTIPMIGRPSDPNEKNQKITVTSHRDHFTLDFRLNSPLSGLSKDRTILNLQNSQPNTIEMSMQLEISRTDLETGHLDQYQITRPPTVSMQLVFDPVGDLV
jgi:hypothetical protein